LASIRVQSQLNRLEAHRKIAKTIKQSAVPRNILAPE
jgi:hypothetical protein